MHGSQALVQLDEVLPMLQVLEQVALGALLTMGQGLENSMPVEHTGDIVQTLLKTGLRACRSHKVSAGKRVNSS